ncbi:MAG: efflux RND transporter periplasmic adaptor subunit [Geminicoccaceae bacterium]|nr:efflux RND transporter periplasmic adaptor subunit [Geminicoccaceae bacterium]
MKTKTGLLCRKLAAVSTVLVFLMGAGDSRAQDNGAQQGQDQRPVVQVAEVKMRELGDRAEFLGRIEGDLRVELRARVTGFLREVAFAEGDQVTKDQLLFLIEPEQYEAAVEQSKAQLASAEADLKKANIDLKRQESLASRNATSQADLDTAIAAEGTAKASVEMAKAELWQAEIELSYTRIESPIDGRVGLSVYDIGNLVGADSGVLATVVKSDPAKAYFEVTQRQLLDARERVGDAPLLVTAVLANGKPYEHQGKIDFFDVKVNPRTDGQIVRAIFPNPNQMLTDGQTVRIQIEEASPQKVPTIPMVAVGADQSGSYVLLVTDDSKVKRQNVKLGPQRDAIVAVREGLDVGQKVIVQGQLRVKEGVEVRTEQAEDTPSLKSDSGS